MGGDLGETGGTVPQNLRWGDGPCIHPLIFGEVVLLQVRTEKLNLFCEIDVFVKKRVIYIYVLYIINEIYEIMSDSRDRDKD